MGHSKYMKGQMRKNLNAKTHRGWWMYHAVEVFVSRSGILVRADGKVDGLQC